MKKCNKCGSESTNHYDGYEHWYTDPLYTSKWLCHSCYSHENIEYYAKLRLSIPRIDRPRESLRVVMI